MLYVYLPEARMFDPRRPWSPAGKSRKFADEKCRAKRYSVQVSLPPRDSELLQIMDAAFADAVTKAGTELACRPGCTQCCHGAFAINALDAERLRLGMVELQNANSVLAAEVKLRALSWIDEYGVTFPGDPETGVMGDSDAEREAFEEFANDVPCPGLDPATGKCDVYAWRPMTCRVFGPPVRMGDGGALGCCELCFVSASEDEIAACEMVVPHELEEELIDEIGTGEETVVAFALAGLGQAYSLPR